MSGKLFEALFGFLLRFCNLLQSLNVLILFFLLIGDEMFSDSFEFRESEDGFFYEVDGKVSRMYHVAFYAVFPLHLIPFRESSPWTQDFTSANLSER